MRILLPSFTHVYRHGFDANPDLDRDRHQNGNSDTEILNGIVVTVLNYMYRKVRIWLQILMKRSDLNLIEAFQAVNGIFSPNFYLNTYYIQTIS
jgi:hypothetical protein